MTDAPDFTALWRGVTVGLLLPDPAFGAAVDIDGLLVEPELHFAATAHSSRLMLMPRAGTFSRLLLEWESLPEIGVFTVGSLPPHPFDDAQTSRLETWMRDVAVLCHGSRDRIREAAERAVRDASEGHGTSLPPNTAPRTHLVSARIGTRVVGPDQGSPFGVVDVTAPRLVGPDTEAPGTSLDAVSFVERGGGADLGRRVTRRLGDEVVDVSFEIDDPRVAVSDLVGWYDQHIFREVLFDDVWQVYVHLIAGLDAPANVAYFGD
jgi:hypothetical protein